MELDINLQEQEAFIPYIITLSNGKKITLNDEQCYALDRLREFLEDRNKRFFCISGSAGTGKTTLAKEAIRGWERRTCITAPTHEAVSVIGEMTGLKSETLHKLLGLRPNMDLEEFDSKNMIFSELANNKMIEYQLVIVDEASMISASDDEKKPGLLDIIKKVAKTTYNTKVIFMGDRMQLPPIGMEYSPVFYDSEIEQVQLTKVERQAGCNPLMRVYDNILSDINSKHDLFEYKDDVIIEDGKELGIKFFNDSAMFAENIKKAFLSEEYHNDRGLYKILCFENESVRRWNNYIRKFIYGCTIEPLMDGEVLKAYTSIFDEDSMMLKLRNSSEYFISDIRKGEYVYEEYVSKTQSNMIIISGFHVTLNPVKVGLSYEFFIMDMTKENLQKYIPVEQKLYWKAKNAGAGERKWMWKEYFNFRKDCLIMETLKVDSTPYRGKPVKSWENPIIEVKKDLDFAYALTIHKSQGRTYKSVFFDMRDVKNMRNRSTEEKPTHFLVNRLNYVALSRPTDMSYVNI